MGLRLRILFTLLFSFATTIALGLVPNQSNIPSTVVIPLLVAGLTKYCLGDWDPGFHWTLLDIPYWLSILSVSYLTVFLLLPISKNVVQIFTMFILL